MTVVQPRYLGEHSQGLLGARGSGEAGGSQRKDSSSPWLTLAVSGPAEVSADR